MQDKALEETKTKALVAISLGVVTLVTCFSIAAIEFL